MSKVYDIQRTVEALAKRVAELEEEVETLRHEEIENITPVNPPKPRTPYTRPKSYKDLLNTYEDISTSSELKSSSTSLSGFFCSLFGWNRRASVDSYVECKSRLRDMPTTIIQMECFTMHTLVLLLTLMLYVITCLPLRVFVIAPLRFLHSMLLRIKKSSHTKKLNISKEENSSTSFSVEDSKIKSNKTYTYSLSVGLVFDIIRLLFVMITVVAIGKLNVSFLYHYIKSQTHFKLFYIIMFADVIASLLSRVEHEALNSLYLDLEILLKRGGIRNWHKWSQNQDDTFVSYSMISNFKDVRKQVFKKADETSLFYVSMRDVFTRLYMILGLGLSLVLYANNGEDLHVYVKQGIVVYIIETCADWIKHVFTCKQNGVPASVYRNYSVLFNRDILSSISGHLDPTHMAADRTGFGTLGMTAYILAVLHQNLPPLHPLLIVLSFLNLLLLEFLLTSVLLIIANRRQQPISVCDTFN